MADNCNTNHHHHQQNENEEQCACWYHVDSITNEVKQAPKMPAKGEEQPPGMTSGMDAFNQPVGFIPVEAPPPYSTVFVQGSNNPQFPSAHQVMYPPGTQIVYRMPQPLEKPPDDHLIYAILVTVFCFWPTGIIAIIKSLDVQKSAHMGDAMAAETSSKSALQMSRISLGIGVLIYILLAVVLMIEIILIFSYENNY